LRFRYEVMLDGQHTTGRIMRVQRAGSEWVWFWSFLIFPNSTADRGDADSLRITVNYGDSALNRDIRVRNGLSADRQFSALSLKFPVTVIPSFSWVRLAPGE
jgi:hypothetical protein